MIEPKGIGRQAGPTTKENLLQDTRNNTACCHLVSRTVNGEILFGEGEKEDFRKMIWQVTDFSGVRRPRRESVQLIASQTAIVIFCGALGLCAGLWEHLTDGGDPLKKRIGLGGSTDPEADAEGRQSQERGHSNPGPAD